MATNCNIANNSNISGDLVNFPHNFPLIQKMVFGFVNHYHNNSLFAFVLFITYYCCTISHDS